LEKLVDVDFDSISDINPASGQCFATIPCATYREIQRAVFVAHRSQKAWTQLPFAERAKCLIAVSKNLEQRSEEIAALVTKEMGKLYKEALSEIKGWTCSISAKIEDARQALEPVLLHGETSTTIIRREPIGVVAAITPWNFPVGMPIELLIPALAVGNTVVFKPSEHVPLVGAAIYNCFSEALPDGVLRLLQGKGDVGAQLVSSDIDMVAFVGSQRAGIDIMRRASTSLKRLILELGGKDPMIVFADADLNAAADVAVRESLRNTGQICNSIERIYIEQSIEHTFESLIIEKARTWQYGEGYQENIKMGPLVNAEQRAKIDSQVQDAINRGAKLLLGGSIPEGDGYFYPATVLSGVTQDMQIAREETFGPVICLIAFNGNEEDAIALANDSEYGLCATIFTKDMNRAEGMARQIRCGQICINRYLGDASGSPWVGARKSGIGFLGTVEGVWQFTIPKSISIPIV
jgi:succinate-semialdehyde dehydrogenase/glutarate-semialdehyde dehydrogenase